MNTKFLSGLFIGAVAGAALALFITSDKGQEIVEDIKDAAGDAADTAKTHLGHMHDELNGLLAKGKAFVGELEKKVKEASA